MDDIDHRSSVTRVTGIVLCQEGMLNNYYFKNVPMAVTLFQEQGSSHTFTIYSDIFISVIRNVFMSEIGIFLTFV